MLHNRYFILAGKILLCVSAAALSIFLLKRILPCVLPFLLAFFTAAVFEPLIAALHNRLCFRRRFASLFVITGFFLLIFLLLVFAAAGITQQLYGFFTDLPEMLSGLSDLVSRLESRIDRFILSAPDGTREYIRNLTATVGSQLIALPGQLSSRALATIPHLAQTAPNVLLFAGTYVIGVYFCSLGYREIKAFLRRQFSQRQLQKLRQFKKDFLSTIGCWLKAQLLLMLITFAELAIALTLLSVPYSLLFALIISLVDALPVLGTGTVLIPWSLYCLLTGSVSQAVGLLAAYLLISLARSFLEPRLVGKQIGLHPVVTLAGIYLGYKVFGFFGIILTPLALIMVKLLNDHHYICLWK